MKKAAPAIGLALIALGGSFYFFASPSEKSVRSAFTSRLPSFLDIPGLNTLPESAEAPAPGKHDFENRHKMEALRKEREGYRHGRMLILDKTSGTIDDLHFRIPKELQARKPEEVGTVVWVSKDRESRGQYVGSKGTEGTGYTQTWKCTIIDYDKKRVTGSRDFFGSSPTAVKIGAGDREGMDPRTAPMIDYFKEMPVR